MKINLTNEDFNSLINDELVLVDFYADWCGPCRMLSPIIEEVACEKNIKLVKVNVDSHEDIAKKYGIMSIPTIIKFQNGKETNKHIGLLSKEDLLELLKED
jgi:thioredoxin 1